MFRASANVGEPSGRSSACIEGYVRDASGRGFKRFGVQVDQRGSSRKTDADELNGVYRICGLTAGEWGISVYMAGGGDIPGAEQVAHQVRVRLTGVPGEIIYVNFQATSAAPTDTPTVAASLYDGNWVGTISGKTEGGARDFNGSYRMEVRNGAIYRISVDGPSCPFETYPKHPAGQPMDDTTFFSAATVFNPQTGANPDIAYEASGVFTTTAAARGTLKASQGGSPCISEATWSAAKQ